MSSFQHPAQSAEFSCPYELPGNQTFSYTVCRISFPAGSFRSRVPLGTSLHHSEGSAESVLRGRSALAHGLNHLLYRLHGIQGLITTLILNTGRNDDRPVSPTYLLFLVDFYKLGILICSKYRKSFPFNIASRSRYGFLTGAVCVVCKNVAR